MNIQTFPVFWQRACLVTELILSCTYWTPLTSQVQLAELIDCLDKEYWEADLYAALEEIRDEVHMHMDITEDLTNKARGSNKCYLTVANGKEPPHYSLIN